MSRRRKIALIVLTAGVAGLVLCLIHGPMGSCAGRTIRDDETR